ncbi:MAG: outer membrane lipoprotein-sorting protein [Candidatus Aminicenantes bacterium]|nr:outer membrane lipoprotein-sorting protein [Candidatus Aminicenantes bacterium]MDH5707171.1 outer membrane lipoprotein-sorting protein [Candidatus Aminicenantes bacterium]
MNKIFGLFCLLALLTAGGITEEWPSGDWVLERVDENIGSDNKVSTSEMVIHGRRGSRSIKSKSWLQGMDRSFTEYLAPAREKGTKMLKLEDQLWIYMPSTDRTIKISGHMLRQSVMGSDLSYEDFMEDPELNKLYEAKVVAEEVFLERPCWVLELTSKGGDIAYHSRKIWVDKERFVSLKEERFAKSGKLLKTFTVMNVSRTQNRWIPTHVVFKDELKSGKGTEFFLESIELNADIPEHVFTKASLRK